MFFPPKSLLILTSVALVAFISSTARSQFAVPSSGASSQVSGENIRGDKETRAPQLMTPTSSTGAAPNGSYSLDEAMEKQVWQEAQKRLAKVEASDPQRALIEYKKFWQGRVPHPGVAIAAALKVVELRLRLKDVDGALLTCDYMQQKYADEPAAVQLALEKARVLVSQKRFDEAAATVDKAMPKLLVLGPQSYPHTSEVLLNLAQSSGEAGGDAGKQWASRLYEGVEQVYLRWLKAGTVSHTWQMFEALQTKYRQVGDSKRADELLPKAADLLLRMEPTEKNPEGADVSTEAARWLVGQGRKEDAKNMYTTVPGYGNGFVTQLALFDQASSLIQEGQHGSARKLLLQQAQGEGSEAVKIASLAALASSHYRTGDMEEASRYSQSAEKAFAISSVRSDRGVLAQVDMVSDIARWSKIWLDRTIVCDPAQLTIHSGKGQATERRISIRTSRQVPLSVRVNDPRIEAHVSAGGQSSEYFYETSVIVKLLPSSVVNNADAVLIVTSPQLARFEARVLIHITANTGIRTATEVAFFGVVPNGEKTTRILPLSSSQPFRILEAKSDDKALTVVVPELASAPTHQLRLELTPSQQGKVYEGKIRITTDSALQQVIEVPYVARAG